MNQRRDRNQKNGRTTKLAEPVAEGVAILLEAHRYAQSEATKNWDFALGIAQFKEVGMTAADLRWLTYKGLVEYAVETTRSERRRTFRNRNQSAFTERTCFVLTEAGAAFARQHGIGRGDAAGATHNVKWKRPRYHKRTREVRVGSEVVKRFAQESDAQERLAKEFQKRNWRQEISNPLPPKGGLTSEERLRDAVHNFNRRQRTPLLRFHVVRNGTAVSWEFR